MPPIDVMGVAETFASGPVMTRSEQKQATKRRGKKAALKRGTFKARYNRSLMKTGAFAWVAIEYYIKGSDFVVLTALVKMAQERGAAAIEFESIHQLIREIGWDARQVYPKLKVREALERWSRVNVEIEDWYSASTGFTYTADGDAVRVKGKGKKGSKILTILRFNENSWGKLTVRFSDEFIEANRADSGMFFLADPDVVRALKYRTEILLYLLLMTWRDVVAGRGLRRSLTEVAELIGYTYESRPRSEAKLRVAIERINKAAGEQFTVRSRRNRERVWMCVFERSEKAK